MNRMVLDTNVAIGWYISSPYAEQCRHWRDMMASGRVDLLVPELHYWEFSNTLRNYVIIDGLNRGHALEIFEIHLQSPLSLRTVNKKSVLENALKYDATAYDAVYITMALENDCPLITAEKKTRSWIRKLGDRVISVRE